MTVSPAEIERLVREVLAELALAPQAAPATAPVPKANAAAGSSATHSAATRSRGNGELVLRCRVVALPEVEGQLDAVRRLVVPRRAVVTPAVRDELLRRNIALSYAAESDLPAVDRTSLVLVSVGKGYDPAALLTLLGKEAIKASPHALDCLIAATDLLARELSQPGVLGLLLTRHAAAALCLANRRPGVRAVSGSDAATVLAGAASVGANLLVVDPTGRSPFELRRIAAAFCRGGVRDCPEVFRARLG